MRKNKFVITVLLGAAMFILTSPGFGQHRKGRMQTPEILAMAKVGQWIKIEGIVQKDGSVFCHEVEFLTGDFLDDDWEFTGIVQKVDLKENVFFVVRRPVKPGKEVEYDSKKSKFDSFDDVKPGMLVDLEGTYLKDGTFLAKEIENESEKLTIEPELKDEVQMLGRIGNVDARQQHIIVMGVPFKLTERTKGKSVIK